MVKYVALILLSLCGRCLATGDYGAVVEDRVEVIELNRYLDEDTGRLLFKQMIFYQDWQVVDWRMWSEPWLPIVSDGALRWYDKRDRVMREVRTKAFIRTWSIYDPEVAARRVLPKEKRRKLYTWKGSKTW